MLGSTLPSGYTQIMLLRNLGDSCTTNCYCFEFLARQGPTTAALQCICLLCAPNRAEVVNLRYLKHFCRSKRALVGKEGPLVDSAVRSDVDLLGLGEDVLRERDRAYSVNPGEENLIVLRDLKKEFPPQDGNPKKTAVENMSVAIARGECFGCGPHGTCIRPMLVQSHFALRPVPFLSLVPHTVQRCAGCWGPMGLASPRPSTWCALAFSCLLCCCKLNCGSSQNRMTHCPPPLRTCADDRVHGGLGWGRHHQWPQHQDRHE